ncbi:MAG: four helix bundle protein [Deltaproteobacteria bacterium]
MVQSYRDLVVWQKAMDLVIEVYRASQSFSKEELFGLKSQIRRVAVSLPSNIAEGHQRLSRKEYRYFLSNTRGSLAELETQVIIASKLEYFTAAESKNLLTLSAEVGRVLNGS